MVGAGGGSGVLTYRVRDCPFRVSGLSPGVTAGASAIYSAGDSGYDALRAPALSVRTTRKPILLVELSGVFELRAATR
jgi:hypothetical protein